MEYCVALATSLSLVFTVWGGGSLSYFGAETSSSNSTGKSKRSGHRF